MKHAFLILAHKHTSQLINLISALYSETNYFFIHVDIKSQDMYKVLKNMTNFPKNTFLCKKQIDVHWGGFSMIEATVKLINMLIKSGIKPDYVHLLSAQDFPLQSPQKTEKFFDNNHGKNFINYFTFPYTTGALIFLFCL